MHDKKDYENSFDLPVFFVAVVRQCFINKILVDFLMNTAKPPRQHRGVTVHFLSAAGQIWNSDHCDKIPIGKSVHSSLKNERIDRTGFL